MKSKPHKAQEAQKGSMSIKFLLCFLCLFAAIFSVFAATYPQWWAGRGVLNTNANIVTNDFAPATLGQLKWMATKAREELNQSLPAGAGNDINQMVDSFKLTNNYGVVTLGQAKNMTMPFYNRLIYYGYPGGYPWTATISDDDDFAPLLLGQMKNLFSFDTTSLLAGSSDPCLTDSDGDGIPDCDDSDPNDPNQPKTIMPAAFSASASTDLLWFGDHNVDKNIPFGSLKTMTPLSSAQEAQQGTLNGADCYGAYGTDGGGGGTENCVNSTTSIWRGSDGLHVCVHTAYDSQSSGHTRTYTGSISLYRASFDGTHTTISIPSRVTNLVVNVSGKSAHWSVNLVDDERVEFVIPWHVPTAGKRAPFEVTVKNAAGQLLDHPFYVAAGDALTLTASELPAFWGSFSWPNPTRGTLAPNNAASVNLQAGVDPNPGSTPSDAEEGETITCLFTPDGVNTPSCGTNIHYTVIKTAFDYPSTDFYAGWSATGLVARIATKLQPYGTKQGTFTLEIQDASHVTIRTIVSEQRAGSLYVADKWDGLDDQGQVVPPGEYNVHAEWTVDGATSTAEELIRVVRAQLVSIQFTSDHGLLKKSHNAQNPDDTFECVGALYEKPEWIPEARTNPITQTMGTLLKMDVTLKVEPAAIGFSLRGFTSSTSGQITYTTTFEDVGSESTAADQVLGMEASDCLPGVICALLPPISWTVSIVGSPLTIDIGTTTNEVLVTYDEPQELWSCETLRGTGNVLTYRRIKALCGDACLSKANLDDAAMAIHTWMSDHNFGVSCRVPGKIYASSAKEHWELLDIGNENRFNHQCFQHGGIDEMGMKLLGFTTPYVASILASENLQPLGGYTYQVRVWAAAWLSHNRAKQYVVNVPTVRKLKMDCGGISGVNEGEGGMRAGSKFYAGLHLNCTGLDVSAINQTAEYDTLVQLAEEFKPRNRDEFQRFYQPGDKVWVTNAPMYQVIPPLPTP